MGVLLLFPIFLLPLLLMKQKTVGILGLGWLGTSLAQELMLQGHTVKGTVRSKNKIDDLKDKGIDTYYLEITENKIYGDLADFFNNLDTIFINIPPGLRKNPESDFAYRIKLLMTFVRNAQIEQVIFVSSTSVFKDDKSIPVYDENSIPNATSNNGKKIAAAEQVVLEFAPQATIIRPCGLIGDNRHPIKMLTGRTHVKNPDAPINLVTRDHVIHIASQLINEQLKATIVHAVSEPYEARKSYYQRIATEWQLPAPEFAQDTESIGKKIVSNIV